MKVVRGRPFRLSKPAIARIESAVDRLFDRAKARVLGPWSVDKRIRISVEDDKTLPALYATAAAQHGATEPSKSILKALLSIPESFIEAQRAAMKAKVIHEVTTFLTEAHTKGVDTDVKTVLGGKLAEVYGKVATDMHRIIDTEAQNVRNGGALDALMRINADAGIEDPVVYYVVVRDDNLCDECKRLHLLEDGVTPRCWYLSELGHGYHKRGDDFPALGGEHPHCRCTLVTLMPGYGFTETGMVTYLAPGHKEIERQRGEVKKAEGALDSYENHNWYVPAGSDDAQEIGGFVTRMTKHPGVDHKGRQLYAIHTHDGRKLITHETPALLKERIKNLEPKWTMKGDRLVVVGPPKYNIVLTQRQTKLKKIELDKRAVVEHFRNKLGFTSKDEGGNHEIYYHPEAPHIRLILQRGVHGSTVRNDMVGNIARQTGTRYKAGEGFVPDPTSPHAPEYRRRKLLPEDETAMRTWTPEGEHQHVPIGKLVSTGQPQPWKVAKMKVLLDQGRHTLVPAVHVMKADDGDGYMIVTGDEQYEAAKQAGMTHVPVRSTD